MSARDIIGILQYRLLRYFIVGNRKTNEYNWKYWYDLITEANGD